MIVLSKCWKSADQIQSCCQAVHTMAGAKISLTCIQFKLRIYFFKRDYVDTLDVVKTVAPFCVEALPVNVHNWDLNQNSVQAQ